MIIFLTLTRMFTLLYICLSQFRFSCLYIIMIIMEHAILVINSFSLSYFLIGLCIDLDYIYLLCMTALLLCDCMCCISMWITYLFSYFRPSSFHYFLPFSSHICICEALCVLVSTTKLVVRNRV